MAKKDNIGFVFYSNYLKAECTVSRYWTDKIWWFTLERNGRIEEFRAGTRLSYFKGQEAETKRRKINSKPSSSKGE